jgi:hypothetical protein
MDTSIDRASTPDDRELTEMGEPERDSLPVSKRRPNEKIAPTRFRARPASVWLAKKEKKMKNLASKSARPASLRWNTQQFNGE